jgi:hypothetical protein
LYSNLHHAKGDIFQITSMLFSDKEWHDTFKENTLHPFTTTPMLRNTKCVDDTPKASDGSEYCSLTNARILEKASSFNWEILRTCFRELSKRSRQTTFLLRWH